MFDLEATYLMRSLLTNFLFFCSPSYKSPGPGRWAQCPGSWPGALRAGAHVIRGGAELCECPHLAPAVGSFCSCVGTMKEKGKVPWHFCHHRLELAHWLCSRTSQINVTCLLAALDSCLTTQHCSPPGRQRQRGPAFLYLSRSISPKPRQMALPAVLLAF